jgi:hypothetical protein
MRGFMGSTPEQLRNGAVIDALAVLVDIVQELEPVELRLEQRRRTADEHTDWRIVCQQRRQLRRVIGLIAQLTPDGRN